MGRLQLSPAARADLVQIRRYGNHQFGGAASDAYFLGFENAFDVLERHPQAGPAKPELGDGIRCLVHRQHRIFYRIEKDGVLIARVIHHAMDERSILKGSA
jgi:toxin ParE1/3/4